MLVDGMNVNENSESPSEVEQVYVPFEASWLEGQGHVCKYSYGCKEVWEIMDSQSSTWTERGLRFKHHNCWTEVMKYGLLGRFVTSWMLEGCNHHTDVAAEISYSLVLRRPICKCIAATVPASANEVPWEHATTSRCIAQRLGIWASPDGTMGCNIPCRDACAPAHGMKTWVGDKIIDWHEDGKQVHLQMHRGRHLCWRPSSQRHTFEGAISTSASCADFHKWFVHYEKAKQICFQKRCLGNFNVAIRWNDASVVDFSRKATDLEEESTEAETADESTHVLVETRLRDQANRDRRAFLASHYWTSMLCKSAVDQLLREYMIKLPDCSTDVKVDALRQAAKNNLVKEEFHEQPWRWVRRIERILRDARYPWLQMSVVNDRTGFDKAGVPVTKKRITKMQESSEHCDLFCFMEGAQWWAADCEDTSGSKAEKELFVGLKSEVSKQFPDKYKLWIRPEKTKSGAARFCKICSESAKRKHLANTHDAQFCKFAPKEVRCATA